MAEKKKTLGRRAREASEETARVVRKWAPRLGREIVETGERVRSVGPIVRTTLDAEKKALKDRRAALSDYREQQARDRNFLYDTEASYSRAAAILARARIPEKEKRLRLQALKRDAQEQVADHLGTTPRNVRIDANGNIKARRPRTTDPLTTREGQRALKRRFRDLQISKDSPQGVYERIKLRRELAGENVVEADMDAVDRFRRELAAQREAEAAARKVYDDKMQMHSDTWDGQRRIRGGLEGQEAAVDLQEAALERRQAAAESRARDIRPRRGREVE